MQTASKLLTFIIAVTVTLAVSAEDTKELKAQETCPVMKGKVDTSIYVDVEGKRVYLCCKGCIAPLTKDPKKYLEKLATMGEAPATLQTRCPVMGNAINKDLFVDVEGKRIYVCCAGCQAPIKKDPAAHIKKITDAGEVPYDTPKKEVK